MRGEQCIFDGLPETTSTSHIATICHIGRSTEELMSLRLMHHFEHFTSDTLLFGKSFWRDQILPLALHHDYLMHAVLTISASHLNYLLPQLAENKRAINIHLSHTLPGFIQGVGAIESSQDSDAVIACGFLLLYYAWSVPFFNETDDSNLNVDSDGLLWFAVGLQEVITAAYETQSRVSKNGGIFANYAIPQYVQMLSDIRTRTESVGQ
ncbi:Protein of unknown function DUF3468 [Penicillium occitanis (nom. inval.)]|nr:hypothetical protein PENOC_053990 [Penicillium occitanis (nom. inval.)]PCH02031.1 Protein of unknown function DUF3468 [Penicillium occitanis (nom. inval.)]